MSTKIRTAGLVICVASGLAAAGPARAFDTAPHFDLTRDALSAEGFGNTAIQIAQVNNWFVDLYENASAVPHSGHADFWKTLLGGAYGDREHWSQAVIDAADRSHFDSSNGGFKNAAALTAEWDRLRRRVYALARSARDSNDPLRLLTVLGISLHQLQDFYTHTNWVEPKGVPGYDGPGWLAQGRGDVPTWFDVAASARDQERLYAGGSPGVSRGHGHWHSDDNLNLATAMNKDWPGRPLFTQAYTAAYFASRQWVQAIRSWVGDEAFWGRVLSYANRSGSDLDHDQKGALKMSLYAGHWQGQGEAAGAGEPGPGGSLDDLRAATNSYFEDHDKTLFRGTWESMITQVAAPITTPVATTVLIPGAGTAVTSSLPAVPSSQPMQRSYRFVRLQIDTIQEIDDMDLGTIDEADYYVQANVGGQAFRSAMIHGYDNFYFTRPNYPFTFLKALPRDAAFTEPLSSLQVEVATSSDWWSGTDDDVYLRINDATRFKLDKPFYNDFEGGDRDVYSIPVDGPRFTIGDVQYLQIEKSPDGIGGGWKLRGVKVWANGALIYGNDAINKWLEDDHRTWRAPGFTPALRVTAEVPVWIALYDEDGFLYGADDHCDLHPDHGRKDVGLLFNPVSGAYHGDYAGIAWGWAEGGDRYGGRLGADDDRARARFRIETLTPTPAQTMLVPVGVLGG